MKKLFKKFATSCVEWNMYFIICCLKMSFYVRVGHEIIIKV